MITIQESTNKKNKSDDLWLLITTTYCTAIVACGFFWAPALTPVLYNNIGLSSSQIGGMFSLELLCSGLASIPAFMWLRIKDRQKIAAIFMAICIIGNYTSAFLLERNFILFLVARVISAFSNASLLILCTTSMGRSSNPGLAFSTMIFGQLILGTIGISLLPFLYSTLGIGVYYAIPATLMIICLPLHKKIKNNKIDTISITKKTNITVFGALAVAATFFLYFCLGGVWPFVISLKTPNHMSDVVFENLLTFSSALGILGAGTASILSKDKYRNRVLASGFIIILSALFIMAGIKNIYTAFLSVLMFKYAWTFLAPSMLTVISLHDSPKGELMNSANLFLGLGLSGGPALCGYILQYSSYQLMFLTGALAAFLAMLSILVASFRVNKRHSAPY